MYCMKGKKKKYIYMTSDDELSRLESVQYATGEKQRAITNSSSKDEAVGTKWEQLLSGCVWW